MVLYIQCIFVNINFDQC